jgi:hypothetical protein
MNAAGAAPVRFFLCSQVGIDVGVVQLQDSPNRQPAGELPVKRKKKIEKTSKYRFQYA